jgi:SAM-dependent methyltransferase
MAFSRGLRVQVRGSSADVIADAGFMPGAKSMGVNACTYACKFVLKVTTSRTIVDPFCGFGTVLAVANDLGLDAVGVDLSKRMCRKARALNLSSETGASVAGF